MKKILSIALGAILTLATSSCEDFLDKKPYNQVDAETDVTDEVAVALTNACYVPLQSQNLYNKCIWALDIVAGNSNVGAGGGDDGSEVTQCANFTALSDNQIALQMWRSTWVGIGHCNDAIANIENATTLSDYIHDRSLGEALFLRAHYYFLLVRLYGNVPIRTEPFVPGDSYDIARSSLEENYQLILDDLNRAYALLPYKNDLESQELGRATKDACLTELAEVYLTLAPSDHSLYGEVVDLCDQITSMGYSLNTPYADNFNAEIKNGPESIFEVQYSGDTDYDFWGNTPQSSWLSTFMGPRNSNLVAGGWGWNQPTQEFIDAYEEGDLRKPITVFYEGCPDYEGNAYRPSWSNTGYNVRKFLVSKTISPETNTSPANFVVYRYADVLLMQAEALNELNEGRLAVVPLNEVRDRAGLDAIPASTPQDQLREIIMHERRMELAFEGHRWFDMIRIDGGQYALDFLHSIGKSGASLNRLLFPIPQTEMDSNSAITQNPGY